MPAIRAVERIRFTMKTLTRSVDCFGLFHYCLDMKTLSDS